MCLKTIKFKDLREIKAQLPKKKNYDNSDNGENEEIDIENYTWNRVNEEKLYMVMDYCPGGELFFHIQRVERFNEEAVKFYGSQLVLALEHLHKNTIIYRE